MSLAIKQSLVPKFGNHESFTIRYAWLKKGYDLVADPPISRLVSDEYALADRDAHLVLGVGKNMARSIRFWVQAARLIEEVRIDRKPVGFPTVFGQALLDNQDGFDPYLEDVASWWLLHWMMLSPGGRIPVWWVAFHTFSAVSFDTDRLEEHAMAEIEATTSWTASRAPKRSTVRKDVLALLRTYAGVAAGGRRRSVDDALDMPFVQLSLLRHEDSQRHYRFGIGPKPGLPGAVAAFACIDFLSRTGFTGRQALVASLATEQGGPGRAFKLGEGDLTELLEKAAADCPDLVNLVRIGGSPALVVMGQNSLGATGAQLIYRHYASRGYEGPEPTGPLLPWSHEVEEAESEKLIREPRSTWT